VEGNYPTSASGHWQAGRVREDVPRRVGWGIA